MREDIVKGLYRKLVPYETRYWFYKLRNPREFEQLREIVYPSPKGDFSLRKYDQLQCIFIHITKSAGTSVAKALFGELPYHYTAAQYRVIYGRRDFAHYFKFAFVRNPWDRVYSAYSYLKGGGWNDDDKAWSNKHLAEINDFNQFIIDWLTPERLYSHIHFWPQTRFIYDRRGKLLLDYLAYFEDINDDFDLIRDKLGLTAELQHTNASDRTHYQDIYSPAAIDKVARLYQRDITLFGYRFDSHRRAHVEGGKLVLDGKAT